MTQISWILTFIEVGTKLDACGIIKFDMEILYINLSNKNEFRENRLNAGH
jgi:hypothetical protein